MWLQRLHFLCIEQDVVWPSDDGAFDAAVSFLIVNDNAAGLDFETVHAKVCVGETQIHLGHFSQLHELCFCIKGSGHWLAAKCCLHVECLVCQQLFGQKR